MGVIQRLFQFQTPFLKVYAPVWLVLVGLLVALDLGSKYAVTQHLNFYLAPHQVPEDLSSIADYRAVQDGSNQVNILGEKGKYIKFRLVFNDRFAFSIGTNAPYVGFFLSLGAVIFLFLYHWHNPEMGHPAAWLLVFSGAFGNLIDKAFVKSLLTREWFFSLGPQEGTVRGVVDFVECIWFGVAGVPILGWRTWPTFNLADSCVSVGMVLLVLSMWRMKPPADE